MTEEEVGFRLALKNRAAVERGVHQVGDEFDRVGDEAARAGRKARTIGGSGMVAFGKSGRLAGRAAIVGFGAASAAIVGTGIVLTKLSKDAIGEARESQKVGAISRAQIKATGQAANISAKGISNLAGRISAKVGIDDEEIQSGANKILMYKNVRNELGKGNKIFDRATMASVNLSAVTGTLTTNSKLLGKVLNDPTKAITGLTKAGVKFTDQQVKQIKTFDEQGDRLSAQKIILKQVEDRVGGVAAKQATWGDKAKVMGDNIKESLGTAILPLLDRTQRWFVREGGPALEGYVDIFEKKGIPKIEEYAGIFEDRGIPAMKNFVDEAKPVAKSILPAIGTGFETIADATKVIAPRMKSIFDGFNNLPDWAQRSIMIGAGAAVIGKKLGAGSLLSKSGALGGVASMAKPTPVFVTNPGFGGGRTKNGTPIVTADDRRKPSRRGAAGRGVGGGLLAFLAMTNDDVGAVTADPFGELGKEIMWPWTEGPFKPKVWTGDAKEMKAAQSDLNRVLQTGAVRGDTYALSLSGVGRAMSSIDRDVRPRVTIDGLDPALAKVNSLRTSLLGLPGLGAYGNGLGVLAPTPRKKPGKGGKGAGGVSPRQAYPFPVVEQPTYDDDYFGGEGSGGSRIEIPVHLNGREIARAVYDDMETQMANQ